MPRTRRLALALFVALVALIGPVLTGTASASGGAVGPVVGQDRVHAALDSATAPDQCTACHLFAPRPATVKSAQHFQNISPNGYRVGIVELGSSALGYDYLLGAGSTGWGVGFYNPAGVCTRVYLFTRGGWDYRWTATYGGQYLMGRDLDLIGLARIPC